MSGYKLKLYGSFEDGNEYSGSKYGLGIAWLGDRLLDSQENTFSVEVAIPWGRGGYDRGVQIVTARPTTMRQREDCRKMKACWDGIQNSHYASCDEDEDEPIASNRRAPCSRPLQPIHDVASVAWRVDENSLSVTCSAWT